MKKVILLAAVFLLATQLLAADIHVTSPAAGMEVCRCDTLAIAWTKTGAMPRMVWIRLLKPDLTIVYTITSSTANNGTYAWAIPCNLPPGNYKVQVGVENPGSLFAISACSPSFSILSCLEVVTPNGGENWQMHATKNISWKASGSWTGTVRLILLQNGNYVGLIASGLAATGTHAWPVGHTNKGVFHGGGFKIRVTKDYGMIIPKAPIADESNYAFSIYKLE